MEEGQIISSLVLILDISKSAFGPYIHRLLPNASHTICQI